MNTQRVIKVNGKYVTRKAAAIMSAVVLAVIATIIASPLSQFLNGLAMAPAVTISNPSDNAVLSLRSVTSTIRVQGSCTNFNPKKHRLAFWVKPNNPSHAYFQDSARDVFPNSSGQWDVAGIRLGNGQAPVPADTLHEIFCFVVTAEQFASLSANSSPPSKYLSEAHVSGLRVIYMGAER